MRALLAFLAVTLVAGVARGQTYEELSSLEREAADLALAKRGLEPDTEPEGKVIGRVHIVPVDVFTEGWLTWANIFHVTTREEVLRRHLVIAPGDPWNADRANESLRILRDPFFHSVVILFPVKSAEPGKVDVLVVTRDIWSLRLNSAFEVQGGILTLLQFSLSENNLLGRRKKVSFGFLMDQGKYTIGPTYLDEAVWGTHWTLGAAFRLIFARDSSELEGTTSSLSVGYPLWSLEREWAFGASVSHFDGVIRSFEEGELRPVDLEATPGVEEAIPFRYHLRTVTTNVGVTRAFGSSVKHHVSVGHEVALQRPEVEEELGLDAVTAEQYRDEVLPRSELASAPYVSYTLFTPRYAHYRNMRTFELREDYRMGPSFNVAAAYALEALGSEANFVRFSTSFGWTFQICDDDYLSFSVGEAARVDEALGWIDMSYSASAYMVTRRFSLGALGGARVVTEVTADAYANDQQNRFFVAGGNTGLRGYSIGQFTGDARVLGHVELRTQPWRIGFLRYGAVTFWDFGHAADSLADLNLHHDVGVGVRILIPQIESEVGRLDWAFALNEPNRGLPGRLSLGFFQVF